MRVLYLLLIFIPIAIGLRVLSFGPTWVFVTAGLALVPLSGLIGAATEMIAEHTSPRIGGLLNVTMGNAAELILTFIAIREGLLLVAKASIAGSILANILLIFGASAVAGGIRHGRMKFDPHVAGISATMMTIAIGALTVPALFSIGPHAVAEDDQEALSLLVSVVLIVAYALYVLYTIFLAPQEEGGQPREKKEQAWSLPVAIGVLAGTAVGAVVMSELLVREIEPVIKSWGLTELFVGFIVIPIIGNAAEHWSALSAAYDKKMDLAVSIAVGSSLQVALFVAPVLVFSSLLLGNHLQLVFNEYELTALIAAVILTALIVFDGEANWVEGMQLVSLYAIFSIAFFFLS